MASFAPCDVPRRYHPSFPAFECQREQHVDNGSVRLKGVKRIFGVYSLNDFEAFVTQSLGSHDPDQLFILGNENNDSPSHLRTSRLGL
jgi:hypothetical protein